jgi:hypothetical protein
LTRKLAAVSIPYAAGATLAAIVIYSAANSSSHHRISNFPNGPSDHVYYTLATTNADAQALGQALKRTGFFNGRGHSVMLSKGTSGTIISFVLNDGAWDDPIALLTFEGIACRVAASIGGFPLQVRLCDAKWRVRKEAPVGRALVGTKDEVFYCGAATADEAEALGRALKKENYLVDAGASIVLSKDNVISIGFVLGIKGAWDMPQLVAAFETLARNVAPSVGGLPIDLQLLSTDMKIRKGVANLR